MHILINALASGFYLSYIPSLFAQYWPKSKWGQGTGVVGTLWGLAAIPCLPREFGRQVLVLLAVFLLSVVISDWAEEDMGKKDDPRIVIDEFIGYWVTVAFLPRAAVLLWTGFIFFRIFDVFKLPWIRRLGDLPGGWGVVLDDVAAGLCANLCLRLLGFLHFF